MEYILLIKLNSLNKGYINILNVIITIVIIIFIGDSMKKKFKRQEYSRYKKLGIKWRRPRGKTSKMRRYEAGKPAMPSIGYGSPKIKRGLHPSGLKDILVKNMDDLENINPNTEAGRISATIGKRKKEMMLTKASELGIKILNK